MPAARWASCGSSFAQLPRVESMPTKNLIIVGDSAFAEVAYEYFTHDSEYEVVAFAVESAYLKRDALMGKPVVAVEEIESKYSPAEHSFFAANVYTQSNRLRARLYALMKSKGFQPASYISSHAMVWRNVRMGEHCFIFENNVVQPFVEIGDDVVLWSGNHIGHHSKIGSHCFIASHVVLSGFVTVGDYAFLGVNATAAPALTIGARSTVGAGALILADVPEGRVVSGIWKARKPEQ
jgi:sugar O-acyltransferase (sialic acid O-acetyltransferase NeuD family)